MGLFTSQGTVETELGVFSVVAGATDAVVGVDCSTTTSGSAVVSIPAVVGATVSSAWAPVHLRRLKLPKVQRLHQSCIFSMKNVGVY